MSPEQKEIAARFRRRAFRKGDRKAAIQLVHLADRVEQTQFSHPPRALLELVRSEDPPMRDLDAKPKAPGRPPRLEQLYWGAVGSRRVRFVSDRKTGKLTITLQHGAQHIEMELDEVQARLLRKAFVMQEPYKHGVKV